MQLYSLQFISFFLALAVIYYAIGRLAPGKQWIALLVGSLFFYCCSGIYNLFFILFTSLSTWLISKYFQRSNERCSLERKSAESRAERKTIKERYARKKWHALLAGLILNFGVLSYIKYWNTLLDALGAGESFLASSLLLPLGISFYTFQSIGYLIDVYNEKYECDENYFRFLLFVSYFPQLIQGPINRYDALATQLFQLHRVNFKRFREAGVLIGYGIMKKYAIANVLVALISSSLDNITANTPGSFIVFGILLYSAQQYADFSGGIDMTRGVSQLLGIDMARNFRQPYFSVSLADFWRRWHITLGTWMRDYVFYPFALRPTLLKLRKQLLPFVGKHISTTLPACLANILVFFLVGLWHGADAHYIAWGLYNGIVIALADLFAPLFGKINNKLGINLDGSAHRVFCIIRTFIVVNIGWYFDRITSASDCLTAFYNTIFRFNLESLPSTISEMAPTDYQMCLIVAGIGCLIVFIISLLAERGVDVIQSFLKMPIALQIVVILAVFSLVTISFMFGSPDEGFMYANF